MPVVLSLTLHCNQCKARFADLNDEPRTANDGLKYRISELANIRLLNNFAFCVLCSQSVGYQEIDVVILLISRTKVDATILAGTSIYTNTCRSAANH